MEKYDKNTHDDNLKHLILFNYLNEFLPKYYEKSTVDWNKFKANFLSILTNDDTIKTYSSYLNKMILDYKTGLAQPLKDDDTISENIVTIMSQQFGKDCLVPWIEGMYKICQKQEDKSVYLRKLSSTVIGDVKKPRGFDISSDDLSEEPVFLPEESSDEEDLTNLNQVLPNPLAVVSIGDKAQAVYDKVEQEVFLTGLREKELIDQMDRCCALDGLGPKKDDSEGGLDMARLRFLHRANLRSDQVLEEAEGYTSTKQLEDADHCQTSLDWLEAKVDALVDKEGLLTGQLMKKVYPDVQSVEAAKRTLTDLDLQIAAGKERLRSLTAEIEDCERHKTPELKGMARKYFKVLRQIEEYDAKILELEKRDD